MIINCPKCARSGIFLSGHQMLCPEHGIIYISWANAERHVSIDKLVRCLDCGTHVALRYTEGFQPALRPYCKQCEKFLQMKSMMLSLDWQSIGHIIELINHLRYMTIKMKED